jgi:hypothetical protein
MIVPTTIAVAWTMPIERRSSGLTELDSRDAPRRESGTDGTGHHPRHEEGDRQGEFGSDGKVLEPHRAKLRGEGRTRKRAPVVAAK